MDGDDELNRFERGTCHPIELLIIHSPASENLRNVFFNPGFPGLGLFRR